MIYIVMSFSIVVCLMIALHKLEKRKERRVESLPDLAMAAKDEKALLICIMVICWLGGFCLNNVLTLAGVL